MVRVVDAHYSAIHVQCRDCGMMAVTTKAQLKVLKFTCRNCHCHKFRRVEE